MAGVEHLIISKIIEEQSLEEASRSGIKPLHFAGDWEDKYQWILDFFQKHNAVPTARAFNRAFGDVEVLDASAETFSGLFEELINSYRMREVANSITEAIRPLDKDDVDGAIQALREGLAKASVETTRLRDFDLIETWESRYQKYVEMMETPNALRGITTGFAGLDRITHGLRPQQFIVLAGEPKRGKSTIALLMAIAAHRAGSRPAFVSFEMSVDEQSIRYDAFRAKVNYDNLLSGNLSKAELALIHRDMVLQKNMQPFIMSEDTSSMTTLSGLANKVQQYQPSVLFVDGLYLMDDENGEPKGSPQALTNISRGLKRMAQRFDIPIVGTTQVLAWKLANKRTRQVTGDSLGYTSSFLQDCDLLLGVERNPDLDDQSILRVVEARAAARGEVHVAWDWHHSDFEEVSYDGEIDPAYD